MRSLLRLLVIRFSIRNRRHKAAIIGDFIAATGAKTALLVGVAGSASQDNESIVEDIVSSYLQIIGALDVVMAEVRWPYVVGDGRALPLRANAVDVVVSNAVIEHVGGRQDQEKFVREHRRVARACVITTPNRWFPIESHTSAVLRHWSPRWRAERCEFTRLLALREFKDLLPGDAHIVGRPWSPTFTALMQGERIQNV